jgi:hypothetical protein
MVRLNMISNSPLLRRSLLLTTALISIWFLPRPMAHAEIVVDGANSVRAHELETWCSHHIPNSFRPKNRLEIRQLTDREMAAYLSGNAGSDGLNSKSSSDDDNMDDIDGVFEDNPPRITLRTPEKGNIDMFTFTHEYGHYVWFDIMNKGDRSKYEAIYKRQRAAHHLVTRYAATDVEEGFAEAFSFYTNQPPMLAHRDSASYQFLNQLLGSGASDDPTDDVSVI